MDQDEIFFEVKRSFLRRLKRKKARVRQEASENKKKSHKRSRSEQGATKLSTNTPERRLGEQNGITKPHLHDFLLNYEGKSHLGNMAFHEIVCKYKAQYDQLESAGLSSDLLLKTRSEFASLMLKDYLSIFANPPGRFLQFNKESQTWNDIGYEKAKKKMIELFLDTTLDPPVEGQIRQLQQMRTPKATMRKKISVAIAGSMDDSQRSQHSQHSQQSQQLKQMNQLQRSKNKPNIEFNTSLNVAAEELIKRLKKNWEKQNQQTSCLATQNDTLRPSHQQQQLLPHSDAQPFVAIPDSIPEPTPISLDGKNRNQNMNPTSTGDESSRNDSIQKQANRRMPHQQQASLPNFGGQTTMNGTIQEWMNLNGIVDKQIKNLQWQSFQALQFQEKYVKQATNLQQQIQLLQTYEMQLNQFPKQLQQQQNAEECKQWLQQLQTEFQGQLQQLQAQQQKEQLQHQHIQQEKLQQLQKKQGAEVQQNQKQQQQECGQLQRQIQKQYATQQQQLSVQQQMNNQTPSPQFQQTVNQQQQQYEQQNQQHHYANLLDRQKQMGQQMEQKMQHQIKQNSQQATQHFATQQQKLMNAEHQKDQQVALINHQIEIALRQQNHQQILFLQQQLNQKNEFQNQQNTTRQIMNLQQKERELANLQNQALQKTQAQSHSAVANLQETSKKIVASSVNRATNNKVIELSDSESDDADLFHTLSFSELSKTRKETGNNGGDEYASDNSDESLVF
ncbi:unnamed protein product [Pseudo-nitzschia multistriata]|uniref:Uncharacterized protein n=1 Tax=Pseudo-nitzschia multistriata TaxID=183589 RepID=A0A448Z306_9STRA|nr:unnamed protein product [Pseudo-nitzschia multistriata]